MDLRAHLAAELQRRRRNRRYSLRAFAMSLGIHNSSVVRLLRQNRRLTPLMVRRLGERLALTSDQIAAACAHEQAQTLLALVHRPGFRADTRWLAMMTGLSLDEVQVTLTRLIQSGRLTLAGPRTWIVENV